LYRALHPSFRPWNSIGRSLLDDAVTPNLVSLDEFDGFQVVYWKYARNNDQRAVAADMEKREYDFYRRNAFGSFSSLLAACAKSVTMLIYLNNFENVATEPNENYSREYFELQSIGADVVYTQNDIEELARVFTGWTVGWVRRADFQPTDLNFMNNPAADTFAINQREPVSAPFNFPTAENWDDSIYTWAFVFRPTQDHDWGEKVLFDQTFGGVDSLGNPLDSSARLVLPARSPPGTSGQVAAAILEEFQLVHDRVNGFRDTAKYIVRKLIQKFVVDDLSTLPKAPGRPIPTEVQDGFDLADDNGDGEITLSEWAIPIPLVLPNGRPTSIFQRLDENDDDTLTITEYREPDLLLDAIDTWQSTDGNLREVLRTILLSDEFLSLDFYRAKVKTPFESALSAMRAVNGLPTSNDLRDIAADLQLSGMELFDFADPTGESELGFDWMHTIGLLERLRLINRGVNPSSNGEVRFSWDPLGIQTAWQLGNGVASVDYLQLVLYGGDLLGEHRQLAIEAYNNPTNSIFSTSEWPMRSATAFLLSLPQFQKQ
ncbi:MAG: DUF1800 domain-containing protein, partial [Planctomycetes bacterium]|nr:DUF1800 domain-containing protein [Planctomycetota bacterium]